MQLIRTKLSQKLKLVLDFFFSFSKSTLNFEHSQKKMTLLADLFPKLRTLKNVVRYMSKKSRFKVPFDRQHRKQLQTLFPSEPQHRYHI